MPSEIMSENEPKPPPEQGRLSNDATPKSTLERLNEQLADGGEAVLEELAEVAAHERSLTAQEPELLFLSLSGKNPFEILESGEKFPARGVLVLFDFVQGHRGKGSIYVYDEIVRDPVLKREGMELRTNLSVRSRELIFIVEPPNFPLHGTNPSERFDVMTGLPYTLDIFQEVRTSTGGDVLFTELGGDHDRWVQLFCAKRREREQEAKSQPIQVARVLDHNHAGDLENILEVGFAGFYSIPESDAKALARVIMEKLGLLEQS